MPLQQSEFRMHGAPGAPPSHAMDRQTLFPVSQLLLQQSEFRLQLPPGPAQPPPLLPAPLLPAPLLPAPLLPPEDVIVHIVPVDT